MANQNIEIGAAWIKVGQESKAEYVQLSWRHRSSAAASSLPIWAKPPAMTMRTCSPLSGIRKSKTDAPCALARGALPVLSLFRRDSRLTL